MASKSTTEKDLSRTATFTVGDATVTAITYMTNRQRANYRRLYALMVQHADATAATNFSFMTAYSSAEGGAWQPAPATSTDTEQLVSFDRWMAFDADLTDEWVAGMADAQAKARADRHPVAPSDPPPDGQE